MTEAELLEFLRDHYSKETAGCEWKEFKNLRHSVSGARGEDVISYVSALANMEGGALVLGVANDLVHIVGIQDFHDYNESNLRFRILGKCTSLDSEGLRLEVHVTTDTGKTVWVVHVSKHKPRLAVARDLHLVAVIDQALDVWIMSDWSWRH
jgi:ATP-dependent DNA helicase RecG